ncbi:hypothetical protein KY343_06845 [Candidatus Woesearchaeota archaeon]|nr:hypothetical protein [Candidatus Woesearchaeota archaeon]
MRLITYLIFLFSLILVCGLAVTSPIFMWTMQNYFAAPMTSCEGIENFYTGDSFSGDLKDMKYKYELCYDSNEGFPDIFRSPGEMCLKPGYDCEDFSKAVMCLCDLYDKQCKYYAYSEYPPEKWINFFDAHSGVELYNGHEWIKIA